MSYTAQEDPDLKEALPLLLPTDEEQEPGGPLADTCRVWCLVWRRCCLP